MLPCARQGQEGKGRENSSSEGGTTVLWGGEGDGSCLLTPSNLFGTRESFQASSFFDIFFWHLKGKKR